MLTRTIAAPLSLLICLSFAGVAKASSGSGGSGTTTVAGDNLGGYIDTTIAVAGAPSGVTPVSGNGGSAPGGATTCVWVAITRDSESTSVTSPGWGNPGSHWYDVTCSDGSQYLSLYVPPRAPNGPPVVVLVSPYTLALSAANRLQLPAPRSAHNPTGQTLTGLATWFWLPASQWTVLSQRTQAGPVFAVATARPISTTWVSGDGSPPLVCPGPGTPYDPSRPEASQSTRCSHIYTRTSADQPQTGPDPNDRFFTVTVTTSWSVTWTGSGGTGGALPAIQRSASFPLAVAKRQTVATGGAG